MTDAVTLPYTITRGAQLRLVLPMMLASPLVLAAIPLFFVFSLPYEQRADLQFIFYALVALLPMEFVGGWVLLKAMQPATLTLYPGYITVKPLPILGYSSVQPHELRVADFTAALLQPLEAEGHVKFSLRRPAGKPLLLGALRQDVAEQLAAKLGLMIERS